MLEEDENIPIGDNILVEDTDEEEITEDSESTSSISEELRKGKEEEIITTLKEKIYKFSLKEKIPYNFVLSIKGENINIIKFMDKNKDINENYNKLLKLNTKFNPLDFIIVFYKANENQSKKYLIENFNSFRKISGEPKYYINSFETYKLSFQEKFDLYFQNTKKNSSKYLELLNNIKELETIDSFKDVVNTFEVSNSEVDIKLLLKENNKYLEIEYGKIIFDKIQANFKFPFIKFIDESGENYYKIYNKDFKHQYFFDKDLTLDNKINTIYIIVNPYLYRNKFYNKIIEINIEESIANIQYPENYLNYLKDNLSKLITYISFDKVIEKNISGEFQITFPKYEEFNLYYMTLFDNITRQFLFIREESSVRSLKETLKIYYLGPDKKKENLNYSLYFNIKQFQGNKYNIIFKSKETNVENIKNFIIIFQKIIYHYNNSTSLYLNIIKTRYTGPEGNGMAGEYFEKKEIQKRSNRKIDLLLNTEPEIFSKNLYVRNCPCPKQPIIIDNEDVKDWKKYNKNNDVVLFPPEDSVQKNIKRYYTCPDDIFKSLSFKENPERYSDYPIIPCCSINKTNEDYYKNYDKILNNEYNISEEYKGKSSGFLKTFKILLNDRYGMVPVEISDFFSKVTKDQVVRYGVMKNSKDSFIHCVFKGVENLDILNKDFENKKAIENNFEISKVYNSYPEDKISNVEIFKKYIEQSIISEKDVVQDVKVLYYELMMQELYQYNKEEIISLISGKNSFFDSKLLYRIFEFIFNINIFVFRFDKRKQTCKLEIPNGQYYHLREIKEELPSLVLLRHLSEDSFDVYELIKNKDKEIFLFPPDVSVVFKKYIETGGIYSFLWNNNLEKLIVRKNPLNNINWNKILNDYKIVSQILNSSGRSFSLTFQYTSNKDDLMTIFIKESSPFNIENKNTFRIVSKKKCIKVFGTEYIEGNGGLFYQINDYKYGVFVPCQDVPKDKEDPDLICVDYELLEQINVNDRKKENIYLTFNNSNIFLDLIKWLYSSEKNNIEDWYSKYVFLDKNMKKEIFNTVEFKIPYIFPDIKNSSGGIKYLNSLLPQIFDKKIYVYKELYDNLFLYLKKYTRSTMINIGKTKTLNHCLLNYEDYEQYNFNTLLIGNKNYNLWKNNIYNEYKDFQKINEEDINLIYPFIWLSNDEKIYFIQNNKTHELNICITICYLWEYTKRNYINFLDYDKYNSSYIWDVLSKIDKHEFDILGEKKYREEEDILGWTFNNTKSLLEKITEKKNLFEYRFECFRKLYDLGIEFDLGKEFSYIIYSTTKDVIKITKKFIVDKNQPFEIYMYQEGGYASMLNVV